MIVVNEEFAKSKRHHAKRSRVETGSEGGAGLDNRLRGGFADRLSDFPMLGGAYASGGTFRVGRLVGEQKALLGFQSSQDRVLKLQLRDLALFHRLINGIHAGYLLFLVLANEENIRTGLERADRGLFDTVMVNNSVHLEVVRQGQPLEVQLRAKQIGHDRRREGRGTFRSASL